MNFDSLFHAANHFAHMAVEMIEAETHGGRGGRQGDGGSEAKSILAEAALSSSGRLLGGLSGSNVFSLAPLSAATIAEKGSDDYLRETGALSGSLETSIGKHEAHVGSNDPQIAWLGLGTPKMPPRPTFRSTAVMAEPNVHLMTALSVF